MAHRDNGALESVESLLERFRRVDVEVVRRLVEEQHVVPLEFEAQDLEARLLTTRQRLELLTCVCCQPVAGQRLHRLLVVVHPVADDVDALATSEIGTIVDLGEHADGRPGTEANGAEVRLDVTAQGREEMALPCAVGSDEADALAEVHLVGERQEQLVDRDIVHLHDSSRRVRSSQLDVDLLIRRRRRGRSGCDELLPSCLGRVGLGRVLEVERHALLHDLHVPEQAALLVVPALHAVAEQLLALRTSLGEARIGTAVDPAAGTLDHHDLGGDSSEQGPVVTHHQDGRSGGADLVLQPSPSGDVEVVVRLVEQQHVCAGRQQQIEHEALAFAA